MARGQCRQLRAVFVVAREQDHAAGQRMADAADIVLVEDGADHVQHHRAERLAWNLDQCFLLFASFFLHDHERDRVVGFVADRHLRAQVRSVP